MSQKLSESERKRLDNLQSSVNERVLDYGRQRYIIDQIENRLENEKEAAEEIREDITELQKEYDDFVQELYKRYGDVAVDLDTGDILEG
jgi:predicted transcriptional regulator